jgi:hypothetical protein
VPAGARTHWYLQPQLLNEETLAVRVHPEFLEGQKLPKEVMTDNIWKNRFKDIRNFERYLTRTAQ